MECASPEAKPTWLYSSNSCIGDIYTYAKKNTKGRVPHTTDMCSIEQREDGTMAVTGGADLKASQRIALCSGEGVSGRVQVISDSVPIEVKVSLLQGRGWC
eukprot:5498621-Pyramimonas_sp.AAC.1